MGSRDTLNWSGPTGISLCDHLTSLLVDSDIQLLMIFRVTYREAYLSPILTTQPRMLRAGTKKDLRGSLFLAGKVQLIEAVVFLLMLRRAQKSHRGCKSRAGQCWP